jgi:hypothetical protein
MFVSSCALSVLPVHFPPEPYPLRTATVAAPIIRSEALLTRSSTDAALLGYGAGHVHFESAAVRGDLEVQELVLEAHGLDRREVPALELDAWTELAFTFALPAVSFGSGVSVLVGGIALATVSPVSTRAGTN